MGCLLTSQSRQNAKFLRRTIPLCGRDANDLLNGMVRNRSLEVVECAQTGRVKSRIASMTSLVERVSRLETITEHQRLLL
jgi:hypothetical protein